MKPNEILAASITDLQNGELKEINAGETKIVLAKANDTFYAVGGICPHLKAPLAKGALCGTKLYCPWHHSAFDITDGHLCEPPAIDGLPRYAVRIEGNNVWVKTLPEEKPEQPSPFKMPGETFVIIGGGTAGLLAAQTLRENGFAGKLVMITKEDTPPYDRTLLSKKFLMDKAKPEELLLRKEDFYQKHLIEIEKDKEVKMVDTDTKTISFTDGNSLTYDKLLVATGGQPNKLKIPGADLQNVYTLRSVADAEKILANAKNSKQVCIIGASFIGMETAASLKTLGLEVTVIAREKQPFEKNFGTAIGELFYKLHTGKGVTIKTEAEVESIEGSDTKAAAVLLKTGERIPADLVIAGIGVHPVTGFMQGVQLSEKDKSIPVDEHLQAAPDVFAAGDIALFPDGQSGKPVRIEHWRLAEQHGRIAALNMLGQSHSVSEIVPFFWTNQFDKRLSYIGHTEKWDSIETDGDVAAQKFLSFYVKDGKVEAVASMGRDVDSNKIEDAMQKKGLLTVAELKAVIAG